MSPAIILDPLEMQPTRPVIFGEVLFDCFKGKEVPGGAPLNVAWHLQALGWNPLLLSRIGMDDQGRDIIARMRDWGMDTTGIQRDMNHPTGRVEVKMEGGGHTFRILENQAYDFIAPEAARCAVNLQQAGVLYHGSLALRADSREAYLRLAEAIEAPLFLDINLRDPWWTKETALDMIGRANLLKLNDEELKFLSPVPVADAPLEQVAKEVCSIWELDALWITLGAKGALYSSATGEPFHVAPAEDDLPVIDTVGAGDAFSAAILGGFLKGSAPHETAECAALLATRICGQRGATAAEPTFYRGLDAVKND